MGSYSTGAFAMYVIFYLALTLLSILWMFSIISRYCRQRPNTTVVVISTTSQEQLSRGLDASVIETFPKFPYATDTGMDTDTDTDTDVKVTMKMTSECAVCLGAFERSEMLRVLPKCGHVFHAECIDAWLQSHATCPFCRANLSVVGGEVVIDVHHHQER